MNWLQYFRNFKRKVPKNSVFVYNWGTKKMIYTGNIHPFVTVKADLIKSQVTYAECVLAIYNRFMNGLSQIYGANFAQLVRQKCETEVLMGGKLSEEKYKELDQLFVALAKRSADDEDQYDRHRVMKFCVTLEDDNS